MNLQTLSSKDSPSWLNPFASYKGYAFYQVNDLTNGHGVHVWLYEVLGNSMKIHDSDDDGFDNVSFHVRESYAEVPEDACSELKGQVGQGNVYQYFARANVDNRVLKVDKVEVVTTGIAEQFCFPSEGISYEVSISADGAVWRQLDVAFSEKSCGWDSNICFLFRAPKPVLCPHLESTETRDIQSKMKDAYMMLKEAKIDIPGTQRSVECQVIWRSLAKINTFDHTFFANVTLNMQWRGSREDVYKQIMQPESWQPSWLPQDITAMNSMLDTECRLEVGDAQLKKISDDIFIQLSVNISGTFTETMELENFPFDTQPLHIQLGIANFANASMSFETQAGHECVTCPEWSLFDFSGCVEETSQDSKKAVIGLTARVQRKSNVYIVRILVVMALVAMLTIMVFTLHPTEDRSDRMSNAVTMLLTAVAYSLVVAGSLPVLGYLTFLDKYVLAILFFISGIVLQVGLIGTLDDEDAEEWDTTCVYIDLGILAVILLIAAIYTRKGVNSRPTKNTGRGSIVTARLIGSRSAGHSKLKDHDTE